MGILESVRREQEQDAKARAYDELQQKAQLGTAYETGLAEMQNKYEQALAERQAAAARSMADMAQGTLYPQQMQPQSGQTPPRNYVSPQYGEPTPQQQQRALDSRVGLAEEAWRGM